MPKFQAHMRVVHLEIWEVEATDESDARRKINDMHPDVIDDTGGEVIDTEIYKIEQLGE